MILILLKAIWLTIPAGFANIAPVVFRSINFMSYPIDLNKKYKGKIIFGTNKTYRGFVFGIISSIIIVKIQQELYGYTQNICIIDYSKQNVFIIGFLLGFGSLMGDLVKSFFKRRFGIRPGDSWVPFDQIDWIIGSYILLQICVSIPNIYILISIILFGSIHPIVNYISYKLGFQKNKI